MVSFVCDFCQETLKKPKLDQHRLRCRNAQFSCVDCSVSFHGDEYKHHTSCMTEVHKYQGDYKKARELENKKTTGKQAKKLDNVAKAMPSLSIVEQIQQKSKTQEEPGAKESPESEKPRKKKRKADKEASSSPAKTTKIDTPDDSAAVLDAVKSILKKQDGQSLTLGALQAKAVKKLSKKGIYTEERAAEMVQSLRVTCKGQDLVIIA